MAASVSLMILALSGCQDSIVHNLSEPEANRLLSKLHDSAIEAAKERQPDGKWMISVASDDAMPAIKLLDSSRLFRLDKADSPERLAFLLSKEEQRVHSERLMSAAIEKTISSIRGVLEAHVHLNLPPLDPLFGNRLGSSAGSASVLIIANSETTLVKEDIKAIVAGAAGISPDAISVVISGSHFNETELTPNESAGISAIAGSAAQFKGPRLLFMRDKGTVIGLSLLVAASTLAYILWSTRPTSKDPQ